MVSRSFSAKVLKRLERAERSRHEAEAIREEKFADTVNVYRDLRDNGNNKASEYFRKRHRRDLITGISILCAVMLHYLTGLSTTFWVVVCGSLGLFYNRYRERQREASKKLPILRHYD